MTPLEILAVLGLTLVAVSAIRKFLMRRGLPHYDASSLRAKLKEKGNIALLDVRTAGERSRGQIQGSVHIPIQELAQRIGELEKFKDREIVCYCQSGSRSLTAAHFLTRRGYRAANLTGGISAWRRDE